MNKDIKHISKLLSLVLRHEPQHIGITLDEQGWTDVTLLLQQMNKHGVTADRQLLDTVVTTNDKQRFAFSEDGLCIRANQGHSIDVSLELPEMAPPEVLYHGTAVRFLDAILAEGLTKQSRQHTHLSEQAATAHAVGSRHGKPVILHVATGAMHLAGYKFYLSANGVWLTDAVPPVFLTQALPTP